MSELFGQLSAYMAAVEARVCACGHDQDAHACTRDKRGCDQCDCDIAIFEIQQGSVRYYDTGEWMTLAEYLRRRRERAATSE